MTTGIVKRDVFRVVKDKKTGQKKSKPAVVWRARYRDETGKEHARHFDQQKDAQCWLEDVKVSLRNGTYADPKAGKITFAAWFAAWSNRQVWTSGTLTSAQQAADSVTFASVRMASIRPSHVQQWVKTMSQPAASRREGLAPTTIRTRFNYVHMCFRAAVEDRIIPSDPSSRIALPRVRRAEAAMTIPTSAQVAEALAECDPRFRPFVAVCAFAGLRLGEAAGLQLGDVDFLRRTISVARQVQGQSVATAGIVPPKQGSERVVFVPDALLAMLTRHVQEFGVWGGQQWLFGNGHVLNRNSAGNYWRTTRDAAGLSGFTLHDLRHFFASGLIAAGCDVVTVQRALGHSSPTITLGVYSHLWPTAADKTRAASAAMMADVAPADSLRTGVLMNTS